MDKHLCLGGEAIRDVPLFASFVGNSLLKLATAPVR